jgi:hypothetical protein
MKNLSILLLSSLLCYEVSAGITAAATHYTIKLGYGDSLVPIRSAFSKDSIRSFNELLSAADSNEGTGIDPADELIDIENDALGKSNNRGTLLRLLKLMRVKKLLRHTNRQRLFFDMAAASAKLRLYPLAMQCYYRSTNTEDSMRDENQVFTDAALMSNPDVINAGAELVEPFAKRSVPVKTSGINQTFNDGKPDVACAVLLHVKQPLPGKRRVFAGMNNVGHTFITLIKYNTDGSIVSRSFGFYPEKDGLLSATPLHPVSFSVIKDDAFHAWDEVVGKFISFRRLNRILRLLDKFQRESYDLNKNNCTDFAICAAMISGIEIQDTKGTWPFGKGNNPACAGQSILEGNFINADTGNSDGLFLCNNNLIASIKK